MREQLDWGVSKCMAKLALKTWVREGLVGCVPERRLVNPAVSARLPALSNLPCFPCFCRMLSSSAPHQGPWTMSPCPSGLSVYHITLLWHALHSSHCINGDDAKEKSYRGPVTKGLHSANPNPNQILSHQLIYLFICIPLFNMLQTLPRLSG